MVVKGAGWRTKALTVGAEEVAEMAHNGFARPRVKPSPPDSVTALLQAWKAGDEEAGRHLMPLTYGSSADHTLQPTALVHETYLRLVGRHEPWQNRLQFFGIASNLMRQILVDHARRRGAAKREVVKVMLDEEVLQEAAEVRGVSVATLKRDWTLARAWLFDRLRQA
jgi:DNA-directed RNA polymerase specialized sigma24 family protein